MSSNLTALRFPYALHDCRFLKNRLIYFFLLACNFILNYKSHSIFPSGNIDILKCEVDFILHRFQCTTYLLTLALNYTGPKHIWNWGELVEGPVSQNAFKQWHRSVAAAGTWWRAGGVGGCGPIFLQRTCN